jgi:hypothetical protein
MDSGPLVAWFSKRDTYHEWAARVIGDLPVGVLVCEAVLFAFILHPSSFLLSLRACAGVVAEGEAPEKF